jgi:Na+-driven multidrug efflux pump
MTGFLMVLWVVGRVDEAYAAGSVHAAASKIIIDVLSLCFVGCMGLGTATATLVSKSLGERRPHLAERYGWTSMGLGATVFGLVGIVEALFPHVAMGLFTTDPAVIAAGVDAMRLMAMVQALIATGLVATQCLFGAGNNLFVMVAEFTLHFGVLIPLSYLLGIHLRLGMIGVWTAGATYIFGLSMTMMAKFRLGGWKSIKI